jgi:stage V sporulation protein B
MSQSTATRESPANGPLPDVARVAGRGAIYITAAKIWFIISGIVIEFSLAYLMTGERYGLYRVVVGAVSIINAVIIAGTYQTVSKFISQDESKADSVKAKSLRLQVMIGGLAAAGFFLFAPLLANYLNDPRLTVYLRIASLITLSYSFYAVFTGYFNGQRRFLTQAALDATYSTLKMSLIVLLVWLGYGVAGGISGFALAAAAVLAISAIVAGPSRRRGEVRAPDLLKFQSYLILFTLVLNLLQKTDLLLIKALSSPDPTIASQNAGYYGGAINFANITYQIVISVTFVVFPLVSQSTFQNDRGRTQSYISNTVRYSLLIMAGVATLFSANASEVLRVGYRDEYQAGATALSIVSYGMLLFGLVHVLTTIISATGRPAVSFGIGTITLAVSASLSFFLIPRFGIPGAAASTVIAMFAGTVICAGYLITKFGAFISVISLMRIALAAGVTYAASLMLDSASSVVIVVEMIVMMLLYIAVLALTGELGRTDLDKIRRVVRSH